MLSDIEIRKQTSLKYSLRDALRAIINAGYDMQDRSELRRLLAIGDKAVGTRAMTEVYEQHAHVARDVDLAALWKSLGVAVVDDTVVYDNSAPLAEIRKSLTALRKDPNVSRVS